MQVMEMVAVMEFRGQEWAMQVRMDAAGVVGVSALCPHDWPVDLLAGVITADSLIRAGLPLDNLDPLARVLPDTVMAVLNKARAMELSCLSIARFALALAAWPQVQDAEVRELLLRGRANVAAAGLAGQLRRAGAA